MNLTVEIPDDLATQMRAAGALSRRALQGLALEEYRAGRLTEYQLRRLLGMETQYLSPPSRTPHSGAAIPSSV